MVVKSYYVLKMYLLRSQLNLSAGQMKGLRRICAFIAIVYIPAWFRTPMSVAASRNDLNFFKTLDSYKTVDEEIALAALNKFSNHAWYLSSELTCLAFFDDDVNNSMKSKMVKALSKKNTDERSFKASINQSSISNLQLNHFVSENSLFFFEIIGIEASFLKKRVKEWAKDESYIEYRNICTNLVVVNEVAERAAALSEEYHEKHTTDEQEWQGLLRTVFNHRQKYSHLKNSIWSS